MSISTKIHLENRRLTLRVTGQMDWDASKQFFDAYNSLKINIREILIDLSALNEIKSPGLGMLLIIRQWAKVHKQKVTILAPPNLVSDILAIAQFEQLFKVKATNERSDEAEKSTYQLLEIDI